jgi:hypothetical protein
MLLFWCLCLLMSPGYAQDMQSMMGDSPFASSLELEALTSSDIKQTTLAASHQFKREDESRIGVFARHYTLANDVSGAPNFTNASAGLSFHRPLSAGRSWGVMGSYGSASDKPFRDGRDGTIVLNGMYRSSEKWLWLGNYSNNRPFMNNIPLPGILYVKEHGREKTFMAGFPFIYILQPFAAGHLSVRYLAILPYNHKLRVLYNSWSVLKPYIGIEQSIQAFFDSARVTDQRRTFWQERKAVLGAEKSFGPFLKIDLQTGVAFDRQFFEARSYMRTQTHRRRIDDGSFVALNLKSMF